MKRYRASATDKTTSGDDGKVDQAAEHILRNAELPDQRANVWDRLMQPQ